MLRLLGGQPGFEDRRHFVALAATKMRSVLIDHARARATNKRGGGLQKLTLSHADAHSPSEDGYEIMALHQALEQLAEHDPRSASVIELTYFGGLTREEVAELADISPQTVDRDLRFARAWLRSRLN